MKALLGGAKRVMLSLAEEASPLGTAAGAIVAVCGLEVDWRGCFLGEELAVSRWKKEDLLNCRRWLQEDGGIEDWMKCVDSRHWSS